jgi:hypothetical protein
MFVGAINQDMRSVLAELAPAWRGRSVYVGCSGNCTVERILARCGVTELHGNDVSLYSCALGHHLAAQPFAVTVKDESLSWLEPCLQPGLPTVATLLLCTTVLQFWGRDNPYHRRMFEAHRRRFPDLHAETVAKLEKATAGVALRSFHAGDVVDFLAAAPADAVAVSFPPTYCLAPEHRILTADLRWMPASDIEPGQRLLAFDEEPRPGVRCRRWRFATVLHSEPAKRECAKVHLANGDTVVCTVDHPWLADRVDNKRGGARRGWVRADQLLARAPFVLKPLCPWENDLSYEAGWLAGMFDGEGCIARSGTKRGVSWNLNIAQKMGPVAERVMDLLRSRGFASAQHGGRPDGMRHISVVGGFPEVLRALGQIRPIRLLKKLADLDTRHVPSVRSQRAIRVRVVAVEPVGVQEVQSIATSTRTYVGEGYLMHNSSGYERLYKKLDAAFAWEEPEYQLFTEERFQELIEIMRTKSAWMLSRDAAVPALKEHQIALVQTGMRSRPVHIYANQPLARLTQPHQRLDEVPWPRLPAEPRPPLAIVPIGQGQLNTLRSEYLSVAITPGQSDKAWAVLAHGELIGAAAFANPNQGASGAWCSVYLMTDFAVTSAVPRLSKLVLAAMLSTEMQTLLCERYCRRIETIGTTAFTPKPVSMKYRGLFELHSRKEGRFNYLGAAGRWTLEEGFHWWTKTQRKPLTATP